MLESVFIMFIAMGFVLFILGIERHSITYSITSVLMWIVILAGQIYIEVPNDTSYGEPAFYGVAIGFIVVNIIWIVIQQMGTVKEGELRPPHLR